MYRGQFDGIRSGCTRAQPFEEDNRLLEACFCYEAERVAIDRPHIVADAVMPDVIEHRTQPHIDLLLCQAEIRVMELGGDLRASGQDLVGPEFQMDTPLQAFDLHLRPDIPGRNSSAKASDGARSDDVLTGIRHL